MARISDNTAHEIARKLTNELFHEKEESVLFKIRAHLVDKTRQIMGERLYAIFCDKTQYFKSVRNLSLYPGGLFKQFFPEGHSGNEIHPNITFPDIPLPQWDKWGEEILKTIRIDDPLAEALTEMYHLEIQKRDLRKKIHCVIYSTIRTENRLKEELPEAYEVLMKIRNREIEMETLSAPCDTIENIRSIVQSNKPHEKSV